MSVTDLTTRRVERILRAGFDQEHPRPPAVTVEMLLELCGCAHERGAHHGPDGLGRCGEDGCGCLGWYPAQAECPVCGNTWDSLEGPCRDCGLTIEEVAERLSRL